MTWFLLLQAIITAATAFILAIKPDAIPTSFGLKLTPDAFLLCYFYAATELSLTYLSLVAVRLHGGQTRRLFYRYFFFVHTVEGAAGIYAITQGVSTKVWANSGAHFAIAFVFAVATFRNASAGRSAQP